MGNFNNNRFNRDRGGDNRTTPPQMHSATCSKCGKSCLVPFKPTGNRPIFCSDCFKTEGGGINTRRPDDRTHQEFSSDRQMYDALCSKCGNRCQVPFQPRPGKQIFCSHCFEQKERGETSMQERPQHNNNEDFKSLNAKLDKIIELLTPAKVVAAPVKTVLEEETEAVIEEMVKTAVKKAPTKKKATPKKKSSAK